MARSSNGNTKSPVADTLNRAADSLAAASRQLKRAAHDVGLEMLTTISAEADETKRAQREADAKETRDTLEPLVEAAEAQLARNATAAREAVESVSQLDAVDWRAVFARFGANHGVVPGSGNSTHARLGLLQRLHGELKDLLKGDDRDLQRAISSAKTALEFEYAMDSPHARHALHELTVWSKPGVGRAGSVREKLAGVRRILAELGEHGADVAVDVTDAKDTNDTTDTADAPADGAGEVR